MTQGQFGVAGSVFQDRYLLPLQFDNAPEDLRLKETDLVGSTSRPCPLIWVLSCSRKASPFELYANGTLRPRRTQALAAYHRQGVIVVFGFEHSDQDAGLVIKNVVGFFCLSTLDCLAADYDSPSGKPDFFAKLCHHILLAAGRPNFGVRRNRQKPPIQPRSLLNGSVQLTASEAMIDSLYRFGTPAELEQTMCCWLHLLIHEPGTCRVSLTALLRETYATSSPGLDKRCQGKE
jgi:hypothetical protein